MLFHKYSYCKKPVRTIESYYTEHYLIDSYDLYYNSDDDDGDDDDDDDDNNITPELPPHALLYMVSQIIYVFY